MARPLRIEYEGALYHVTSRGNAGQEIFVDDEDRHVFLCAAVSPVFTNLAERQYGAESQTSLPDNTSRSMSRARFTEDVA